MFKDNNDNGKEKLESIKKREFFKQLKILSTNFKNVEKEQVVSIVNKKSDEFKEFSALEEIALKFESERKEEKVKINQQLNKANQMVQKFQAEVKYLKPIPETVEKLKIIMENIENTLSTVKCESQLKYDELLNEEKLCDREIELFEKKIHAWLTQKNDDVKAERIVPGRQTSAHSNVDSNGSEILPEVIAFDKFLISNGGHTGSWDAIDHNIFIKCRQKHRGKDRFLSELNTLIVTKTQLEIENHEKWYQEYTKLADLKKEAIRKWRESKQRERDKQFEGVQSQRRLEELKQKEMRKLIEEQKSYEKHEKVKKLNEWRLECEIERAREEERKRREEQKRHDEMRKKQDEHFKHKELIDEYKRKKEEQIIQHELEQFLKEKAERDMKAREANQEIVYYQQRDLAIAKEKLRAQKEREREETERRARLEQFKINEFDQIDHDPRRTYGMTKAWKERLKTSRSESVASTANILPLNRIQHLAIPSWRQQV